MAVEPGALDRPHVDRGRSSRFFSLLPVLLAVLPLLPSFFFILSHRWPESATDDDAAILEIGVLNAAHGEQLVGPYSRFGFSHPGPAEFYALLPFYLLAGKKAAALHVGALILNAASAAGIVFVAGRLGGRRRAWLVLALLSAFLAALGPSVVASFWNPHIPILPFALFLLLATGLAIRGPAWLPALAVVGSFVVQTHLGFGPSMAISSIVAFLAFLRVRRSEAGPAPFAVRPWLVSVAVATVLCVLWAPPLVEEVGNTPGNISSITRFFLSHGAAHRFDEVFLPLARSLASVPLTLATLVVPSTSDNLGLGAGFLTLLLVGLLPLALARASARGDEPTRAMSLVALAAVVAALWSVLKIRGEIPDYLVLWTSAVGLVAWTAVTDSALGRFAANARPAIRVVGAGLCLAIVLLATAYNARQVDSRRPIETASMESIRTLSTAVRSALADGAPGRPLLRIVSQETWVPLAGVLRDLRKAGVPVSVEEDWVVMFGSVFRPTGAETRTLAFAQGSDTASLAAREDYRLVAVAEGTSVFEGPAPIRLRAR